MKLHIPLFIVCITIGTVGCATSQEQLIELSAEAKECVKQSTNLAGVIGATSEQRTACWSAYNDRTEELFKISERRRKEQEYYEHYIALCGSGYPVFKSWGGMDKYFAYCGGRYYQ
ncbi:hypothetical protein LCGC14_2665440 [marine sediment metagenome]|uniref:Uncharacterized protein n=1 Tax=marine sediment metagenome TaxID=412755 RepID=A0A0F8ZQL4_9ZZZZ